MEPSIIKPEALLTAIDPGVPIGLCLRLDIENYLDQLDHVVKLTAKERQHLNELLVDDESHALREDKKELQECARVGSQMNEVLLDNQKLTQQERAAVIQFQLCQINTGPISGEFALGNILVAHGQITRPQLDSALREQIKSGRRLGEELIMAGHANTEQIETGLLMQRKLVACALAVTVGLTPITATTAEAAQTSAEMGVSVTVVAHAKMQTVFQEKQLKISNEDVARGFVEVASASRFSVSTNSQSGYLMEFYPVGEVFDSVKIVGLGSQVHIGADGGVIVQRGQLLTNFTHELSFRFELRPEVLPGNYPWPLQLSVRAL